MRRVNVADAVDAVVVRPIPVSLPWLIPRQSRRRANQHFAARLGQSAGDTMGADRVPIRSEW